MSYNYTASHVKTINEIISFYYKTDNSKSPVSHLLVKGKQCLFALDGIEAHVTRLHPPVMSDGVDVLPALLSCNLNVPREFKFEMFFFSFILFRKFIILII